MLEIDVHIPWWTANDLINCNHMYWVLSTMEMKIKKVKNTQTAISVDEFNQNEEKRVYVTKTKFGENVGNFFSQTKPAKFVLVNSMNL